MVKPIRRRTLIDEEQTITQDGDRSSVAIANLEMTEALQLILKELQSIKKHLEIITGEHNVY